MAAAAPQQRQQMLLLCLLAAHLWWRGALARSDFDRERDRQILGNGTCVTITEENWDRHMSRDQHMLVIFHVDWCQACRRTFPIFLEAAQEAHRQRISARFGQIDCAYDKRLCNRFDVIGYPTIKLFAEGESIHRPRDAICPRTVPGFLAYLRRMVKAPVQQLSRDMSKKNRLDQHLKDEHMAVFVGIMPDRSENPVGLQASADAFRDRHTFYHIPDFTMALAPDSPLIAEVEGATMVAFSSSKQQWAASNETARPAVAVYKHSLAHNQTVVQWVGKHRFPGMWKLNETNFNEFVTQGRKAVIVVVNPEMDNSGVEEILRATVHALHDEYVFGVLNGLDWEEHLKDYNIYVDQLPRVFVLEHDLSEWIEDIELLRVAELESDLRALLAGAPILRQGYTPARKLRFHARELKRKLRLTWEYAHRGPREAGIVAGAALVSFAGAAAAMVCFYMIFKELLLGDSHAKTE